MREPLFLKNNRLKWQEYQQLLFQDKEEDTDPDRMADLYISLTDDLAYSRTFYPRSKVVKYLNGLAAQTHMLIFKNKREKKNRLLSFWAEELPEVYGRAHRYMLYALIVFLASAALGWISTINDSQIPTLLFGEDYMNMTIENIQAGNPTGVYQDAQPFDMFMRISVNNVKVSFAVFVGGILLGLGTIYMLFYNGFMVGVFFGLFYTHNVFDKAAPVVLIHGTLELSAIVIAAGAGFMLGSSFMFPGTFTRLQSLQKGAIDSVKIMIGLVPIFTVAAFLESYITRYSNMHIVAKGAIIVLSAAFILLYYVIYPIIYKNANYGQNQTI